MSEPKIEVAPPAGAVITVTVFVFMSPRSGSFQVSSCPGMPAGGPACGNAVPDTMLNMMEDTRSHGRTRITELSQ